MPLQNYAKLKVEWRARRQQIRRWFKQGQSMREIANKLELSVQRVHKVLKTRERT